MASIIYQVEELDILNEIAEIVSEFALEEEFSKVYITYRVTHKDETSETTVRTHFYNILSLVSFICKLLYFSSFHVINNIQDRG